MRIWQTALLCSKREIWLTERCKPRDRSQSRNWSRKPRITPGNRLRRYRHYSYGRTSTASQQISRGRPLRVLVDGPLVANEGDNAIDACRRGLGCGIFLHYQVGDALAAGELRLLLDAYEPAPLPVDVVYP